MVYVVINDKLSSDKGYYTILGMESNTVVGPGPGTLNADQEEALQRAIKSQKKQEKRVAEMTPEEKAKWGITTDTASEQGKLDEQTNPSGVATGE